MREVAAAALFEGDEIYAFGRWQTIERFEYDYSGWVHMTLSNYGPCRVHPVTMFTVR